MNDPCFQGAWASTAEGQLTWMLLLAPFLWAATWSNCNSGDELKRSTTQGKRNFSCFLAPQCSTQCSTYPLGPIISSWDHFTVSSSRGFPVPLESDLCLAIAEVEAARRWCCEFLAWSVGEMIRVMWSFLSFLFKRSNINQLILSNVFSPNSLNGLPKNPFPRFVGAQAMPVVSIESSWLPGDRVSTEADSTCLGRWSWGNLDVFTHQTGIKGQQQLGFSLPKRLNTFGWFTTKHYPPCWCFGASFGTIFQGGKHDLKLESAPSLVDLRVDPTNNDGKPLALEEHHSPHRSQLTWLPGREFIGLVLAMAAVGRSKSRCGGRFWGHERWVSGWWMDFRSLLLILEVAKRIGFFCRPD